MLSCFRAKIARRKTHRGGRRPAVSRTFVLAVATICMILCGYGEQAWAASLTEPVGSTSPVQTATLTFTASGTLGAIEVLTLGAPNLDFVQFPADPVAGQTCIVGTAYTVGQTCTVTYTFTPTHPGPRYGGVTLTTSAGVLLGNGYISGIGTGPQVIFSSNNLQSVLGSGFSTPLGVAVDGSGNIFVADGTQSAVKEILAAGGYTTVNTLGSGFNFPTGVAVDGNGNVFVADSGNNAVKEILAPGGYTTINTLGSGFYHPYGVAVDGSGNVYVADSDNNAVKEILASGGYTTINTLGSGFNGPYGVAVDGSGNVYVADTLNNAVKEILAAGGYTTVDTLGSGFYFPHGVAVDASGNVFVADWDNNAVKEILASGGYTTVNTLGSGFDFPISVAVDASGNVYVGDSRNNRVVKLDYSDPPTLTFATTVVGQTSAPQTVTLTNDGNENLPFSATTVNDPTISQGFTVGSGSTCPLLPAGSSLVAFVAAGASCNYQVSFTPVTGGVDNGFLVPTDNDLNVANATQSVPLIGTGEGLIPTTSTLTVTPTAPVSGQTVVLTATVTASSSSGSVPTGTVTFTNNSMVIGVTTLPGSGNTTLSYLLPVGQNMLSCFYSGDSNYASGSCTPVTINPATTTQTITFLPPNQTLAGTSVLLSATGGASGNPVVFSVVSGPAYVSGLNGEVLTYTGQGTVVVEADQAGNSTYSAAPPVQKTLSVTVLSELVGTLGGAYTVITFSASGTLGSISVLTQGAANLDFSLTTNTSSAATPCAVGTTYTAGQICSVGFNFTPTHPGLRYGGITLTSSSGALLANSYIYGYGDGPQVIWTPGAQSMLGSGFNQPSGVAIDANGDIYVSDRGSEIVKEIPAGGGPILPIGALDNPSEDVDVDGSGNLFVIEEKKLYEVMAVNGVIPTAPAIPTIIQLATTFGSTHFTELDGLKVDGNGNVFLANGDSELTAVNDSAVYEVVAVNGSIPANPTVLTLGDGFVFNSLTGVAVDVAGNVFVSDGGNEAGPPPAVYEMQAVNGSIPAVNPTILSLGSGYTTPSNVALDGAGNVFVTDAGASAVYELLNYGGVIPTSNPTILKLGSGFSEPQGIVVSQSGNVFVADSGLTQIVALDYADPPSLTFDPTVVGQTSADSPQTVTMMNDGNTSLVYAAVAPPASNPSITAGFTLGMTSSCVLPNAEPGVPTTITLLPDTSCTDLISFKPIKTGTPDTGFMTTTDNDLNATNAQQVVPLNGNAIGIAPTIVFNVSNQVIGNPPFTVAATSNSTGAFTYSVVSGPATIVGNLVTLTGTAGTVTLEASQAATSTYTAGTADATFLVSKEPQTINFTPPPSPVNVGVPPITLVATASSGLPVTFSVLSGPGTVSGNTLTITGSCGTVDVAADQAGNAVYAPAPEVTHTVVVIDCVPTITLTAAPNPVFLLNPVTLTATLLYPTATPTGTVQFLDGSSPLGTGLLNGGVTAIAVSTLSVGPHSITAVYSGDNTYAAVTSSIVIVIVQDFTLTVTNPTLTISHGGTATYALVLTSLGGAGMAATINLAVSGPPDNSTVTFTPASVPTGSGTTNVSLVIVTPDYPVGPWGEASLGLLGVAGLLLTLSGKRRILGMRMRRLGCILLLLAASAACSTLTGCGWGWGPQHYNLTVTASSGPLVRTASARFTSQ